MTDKDACDPAAKQRLRSLQKWIKEQEALT